MHWYWKRVFLYTGRESWGGPCHLNTLVGGHSWLTVSHQSWKSFPLGFFSNQRSLGCSWPPLPLTVVKYWFLSSWPILVQCKGNLRPYIYGIYFSSFNKLAKHMLHMHIFRIASVACFGLCNNISMCFRAGPLGGSIMETDLAILASRKVNSSMQ